MMSVWLFGPVQGQPCSGETAFDEAGLVLDLLQAVPDDLDQVGEAGDGEVGQHAALEHRPDPLHRIKVRRISGQPEHPQPGLGASEGAQLSAQMHVELSHTSRTFPPGSCRCSVQVKAFVSPLRPR